MFFVIILYPLMILKFWQPAVTQISNVKVKESLLISRDEPILKKNEKSLPLLPIWLIPPMRNYILMIFIIVTIIVFI